MSAWAPVKAPTARSETPQQPSGSEAALTAKAEKLLALHISKHIQARGKAFERVAPSIKIGRVWPDPLNRGRLSSCGEASA
ncbi:hypothetical protein CSUI_005297 [Cystoisospora suis]|uniref:Uncharacterized protein n=1 Tax=Cystoisospora suis TaxID=483139 RepID=A0A2C6KYI1_9APIC|nr:hypothetical protein CSUI_005297 [Cystoisospora suis]